MQGKARRAVVPFIWKSKKDIYLVPEVWRPIFCKSKEDLYLVPDVWRPIFCKSKEDLYLVPDVWRPIFCKSKEDLYLVPDVWRPICLIKGLYFVVSISITACSIIMDVALVIKTAERHLIYFIATNLMFITSDCFHFVTHLFFIY